VASAIVSRREQRSDAVRRVRASLRIKLLISYLLVVLAGAVTLFIAVSSLGPSLFTQQMQGMMGGQGLGGMMGNANAPISTSEQTLDSAFRAALMGALLYATLLAGGIALLLSLFVSRQIVRPVRRMLSATQRIASGHYAERVDVPAANQGDELGALAASFNEMAGALERTERRRLELVGDVAHELRTPVATLEGYLEGLLDGVVEASPETWAKLHHEAGRLSRLVDDLQELSRVEARQIALKLAPVAPRAIVEAAVERVAAGFTEKGLELGVSPLEGLPLVRADQDRAVQVLTNLLTNALRYTPAPGHVTVTARRAGSAVAFAVSDSGVGLRPEELARVFERFYRVDKSRSRALGGAGIGLTIARALVEAMGGRIGVESAGPGRGTTFTFTLPVAA
jgi:two-component system sensor histidine kinase BaeS